MSETSIIHRTPANLDANPPVQEVAVIQTTAATFQINNAKLFVPAVTFFVNKSIRIMENVKEGFKRTISWKIFRKKISRR